MCSGHPNVIQGQLKVVLHKIIFATLLDAYHANERANSSGLYIWMLFRFSILYKFHSSKFTSPPN